MEKRLVAIVAAAGIVAAAIIGIGLASFNAPGQQNEQQPTPDLASSGERSTPPNGQSTSDTTSDSQQEEDIYNLFLGAGWPDESARAFSAIRTEFLQSNNTHQHYLQVFPSGMIRDVGISLKPGVKYTPVETDRIVTHLGFEAYVMHARSYSSPDVSVTEASFFVPYTSLDPEMVQEFGWGDPHSQVSTNDFPGIQYAAATTDTTGVSIESSNTFIKSTDSSPASSDMDARLEAAAEDVASMKRQLEVESRWKEGLEFTNDSPDDPTIQEVKRRLSPEAQALAREQAEFQMRETQELIEQLKTKHELKANTAVNKKWLIRATGALGTGLAAYELYSIDQQYDIRSAWISYLEDCIKNPTIPRFADPAGRPDPGFDQSISQIESAKEGLKVTTSAMYVASAANGAAGLLAHNPAVEALTMLMSTVENGLLSETAELDIRDLMKNNPCKPLNPCEETPDDPPSPTPPTPYGDYTPGPGEAGFFMTMGPREWYEPPERRQVQCKPEWNEVRLAIDMAGPRGSLGEEVYISFDASTNVTNLADLSAVTGVQNYTLEFGEFFGNATSNLSYKEIWRPDDPVNTCTITINGPAEMRIVILPNMSGPMVDGVYTLAEASVEVVGPLPVVSRPAGCDLSGRGVTGGDTGDDAILFCSFGEVDLRGGSYKNWLFSEGDDGCRLFMGPLDPSKMTPAVHHPVRR